MTTFPSPSLAVAAPVPVFTLLFVPERRFDFALLDTNVLPMYADGHAIGFVYARLRPEHPVPQRLVAALGKVRWVAIEPHVRTTLGKREELVVYTALLPGDVEPYVLCESPNQAPAATDAARDFLVNYSESILDVSLSRFSERVYALADEHIDVRHAMLDGLKNLHVCFARAIGLHGLLRHLADTNGVVLRMRCIGDERIIARMGPGEINAWLTTIGGRGDLDVLEYEGELAEDYALTALPVINGPVYVSATVRYGDGAEETLLLAIPADYHLRGPDFQRHPLPQAATPSNIIQLPVRPRISSV